MALKTLKNKSQRSGKFIGSYVDANVKLALEREAKSMDRSVSWLIKKILAEGVKHRAAG